jgi:hypothetical protein
LKTSEEIHWALGSPNTQNPCHFEAKREICCPLRQQTADSSALRSSE